MLYQLQSNHSYRIMVNQKTHPNYLALWPSTIFLSTPNFKYTHSDEPLASYHREPTAQNLIINAMPNGQLTLSHCLTFSLPQIHSVCLSQSAKQYSAGMPNSWFRLSRSLGYIFPSVSVQTADGERGNYHLYVEPHRLTLLFLLVQHGHLQQWPLMAKLSIITNWRQISPDSGLHQ